jgi:superfamily II DNA/RNA helicase
VHRIGRTGRAGLQGTAITLVTPEDKKSLDAIEKLIGQPIAWDGPQSAEGEGRGVMGHDPAPRKAHPERSRAGAARRAAPTAQTGKSGAKKTGAAQERHAAPARSERPAPEHDHVPAPRTHEGHQKPRRQHQESEPAVLGLGDHVPSFLLRSVRSGS